MIATAMPLRATDFTLRVAYSPRSTAKLMAFLANLNSFVFDYSLRLKLGGMHVSDYVTHQLPLLPPMWYEQVTSWFGTPTVEDWLERRVIEMVATSEAMSALLLEAGYGLTPFIWNTGRRELIKYEVDAAFFHLYRLERIDVEYIMDTFPIVQRNDEREHGEYRTKRLILEIYDEMAKARETGEPYVTRLDPPPADDRCRHPHDTGVRS